MNVVSLSAIDMLTIFFEPNPSHMVEVHSNGEDFVELSAGKRLTERRNSRLSRPSRDIQEQQKMEYFLTGIENKMLSLRGLGKSYGQRQVVFS